MRKTLIIVFGLIYLNGYSQKGIKIVFANQILLKEENLNSVPVYLREAVIKQSQNIKKESFMLIQNDKVYFESKSEDKEVASKDLINTKEKNDQVIIAKNLSTSTSFSFIKIIKDPKTNTYSSKEETKLKINNLPVAQWVITKKQKKILGYTCYEAETKYKNKNLTVFFTNELNAIASPSKLPFIDGVVLEYSYGSFYGKAVKIELNQPTVINFL